jgi:hypothetical protein
MNRKNKQEAQETLAIDDLESVRGGALSAPFRTITFPVAVLKPVIKLPFDPNIFA